jgi:thiamine-monophosphate kinase
VLERIVSKRSASAPGRLEGGVTDVEVHRWLEAWIRKGRRKGVLVDRGADVAAVRLSSPVGAFKVDPTVEGIHFERGFRDAGAIARKAIGRAASDCAAAGVKPEWALVSLEFPREAGRRFVRAMLRAVDRAARSLGIAVVGGHTSFGARAELALHVFLAGGCQGLPLSRKGARAGDRLIVTGSLGGSRLGGHLRPKPRLGVVAALRRVVPVHASIDVSDGLALDAWRLAEASGVGAEIACREIPVAPAAHRLARRTGLRGFEHALGDGEDYELLLAIPKAAVNAALRQLRRLRVKGTEIGVFRRGRGLWLREPTGALRKIAPRGYVQFSVGAR